MLIYQYRQTVHGLPSAINPRQMWGFGIIRAGLMRTGPPAIYSISFCHRIFFPTFKRVYILFFTISNRFKYFRTWYGNPGVTLLLHIKKSSPRGNFWILQNLFTLYIVKGLYTNHNSWLIWYICVHKFNTAEIKLTILKTWQVKFMNK